MEVLIPVVKALAPVLAGLLSGPLGGPILKLLGSMLATKPEAASIAKVITSDPLAPDKLRALEAMLAETSLNKDSIDLVAQAYMKELDRGFFWSALRPAAGWVMIGLTTAYSFIVLKAAALGVFIPMDHFMQFLGVLSPLAAVTGVYFWGRTSERNAVIAATVKPNGK